MAFCSSDRYSSLEAEALAEATPFGGGYSVDVVPVLGPVEQRLANEDILYRQDRYFGAVEGLALDPSGHGIVELRAR
jgi:hypothetical protein